MIAKTNFVIFHSKKEKEKHDELLNLFEKKKEVDDWLINSGESDETAVSKDSILAIQQKKLKASQKKNHCSKLDEVLE